MLQVRIWVLEGTSEVSQVLVSQTKYARLRRKSHRKRDELLRETLQEMWAGCGAERRLTLSRSGPGVPWPFRSPSQSICLAHICMWQAVLVQVLLLHVAKSRLWMGLVVCLKDHVTPGHTATSCPLSSPHTKVPACTLYVSRSSILL